MNDEAKKYNGWKNYETWCVHLWLTNEEATYRYWRDAARQHRREAPSCANVTGGIWSVEQATRFNLADQLRSELEEASPLEGVDPTVVSPGAIWGYAKSATIHATFTSAMPYRAWHDGR